MVSFEKSSNATCQLARLIDHFDSLLLKICPDGTYSHGRVTDSAFSFHRLNSACGTFNWSSAFPTL